MPIEPRGRPAHSNADENGRRGDPGWPRHTGGSRFILRFVSYALAVGEPMQRRFRQLYPPAAFRNDVRRINRLDDEQNAKLLLMRQDAIAGHIGAAATVHQTDHADAVEVARLNEKLGLNSCARR